MAECLGNEEWSMQAMVRGSTSGEFTKNHDNGMNMDHTKALLDFSDTRVHQELDQLQFYDLSYDFSDELEELYKPICPRAEFSLPSHAVLEFEHGLVENVPDEKVFHDQSSRACSSTMANRSYTPKYKKRKNQHKRVEVKVSAEGLSSDLWAWRKYGQKPIKGSPYPRSYYRCSSSKGCLARKLVEQSCTDPRMFIITYIAEHCHSQPTRRNSLAGTVRQKFPTIKQEIKPDEPETPTLCSPETPHEMGIFCQAGSQQLGKKNEHTDDNFGKSAFELDEDLFSGLQDFDEFVSELPKYHASPRFHLSSCS